MLGFIRLLHLDLTCLIPFGQHVQHHDQFGHQTCFRSVWSSDISRLDRPLIMKKQVLNGNLQVFLVVCGFLQQSQGPNHTYSGDGHDKLMDFMNNRFPLAVYGLQDVFSGYILYLKLWPSNSDPKLIARWYLEYLYESRGNCS